MKNTIDDDNRLLKILKTIYFIPYLKSYLLIIHHFFVFIHISSSDAYVFIYPILYKI